MMELNLETIVTVVMAVLAIWFKYEERKQKQEKATLREMLEAAVRGVNWAEEIRGNLAKEVRVEGAENVAALADKLELANAKRRIEAVALGSGIEPALNKLVHTIEMEVEERARLVKPAQLIDER